MRLAIVLSLCCTTSLWSQEEPPGFLERSLPPSSYPQLAEGRKAVAEIEATVTELDRKYREGIAAAKQGLQPALARARELAIANGHPEEAERLIAFEVDFPSLKHFEPRQIWVHPKGHFEKLFNGLWIEFIGDGNHVLFQEGHRTSTYVELLRIGHNVRVRLEPKRCLASFNGSAMKQMYTGKWQERPVIQDADMRKERTEEAIEKSHKFWLKNR